MTDDISQQADELAAVNAMLYKDNHPFADVVKNVQELLVKHEGKAYCFQKFTCGRCGSRLTVHTPNVFYTKGECEACRFTTDLQETGCNFLLALPLDGMGEEDMEAIFGRATAAD